MQTRSVPKLTACVILAAAVFPPPVAAANDDRQEQTRPVAVDTSRLRPYLAAKVQEKASQGAVPLVRYLHAT
ncbi:MAG TPA: hypothetical protein VM073_05785, partial [Usitatibacter sp.]|nr:hypothetical protein [Usitatibacter sp.]